MEEEINILKTLTISFALLIIIHVTKKLVHNLWWRPKRIEQQLRQQGVRGTSYKFWYGDLSQKIKSSRDASLSKPLSLNHQNVVPRVIPFLNQMVRQYGNISHFWFGRNPCMVIDDVELVRLILQNKNGHFIKPPRNPLVNILHMGVANLDGEIWSKRRKLTASAFLLEKLKAMIPAISTSCCSQVQRWQELVKSKGSYEVDVFKEFYVLTGDAIGRTAFGSSYNEGKKIFDLQYEQALLVLEAYFGTYIPGFRFIATKKVKRRYQTHNEISAILKEMIKRKEHAMKTGAIENHDLLSLLLENKDEESNSCVTIDDVIEECKLFYFACQETTTDLLTYMGDYHFIYAPKLARQSKS